VWLVATFVNYVDSIKHVMGILRIKAQKVKRKTTNRKKYILKKPDDIECQRMLKAKLREGASSVRYVTSEGVEQKWEGIKTMLQDICEGTLGLENNKKKVWISDSTWKMIERRNKMKGRICAVHARTRKRKELEKEYAALSKEVNKSVRKDYGADVDSIANEAQITANQGNIKGMFSSIRRLMKDVRPATIPIRDKEGRTITSTEGQIRRWKEFLEEILNTSTSLTGREEPVSLPPELPISIKLPLKREIVDAIKAMKNGKASGSDNILAEVVKADPYATTDILLPLFQDIWQKEKFPKEWKEGILIKVPKKGDLSQCRNWRGVTLLVVISKIFNKIILERIKSSLEKGLRK
jgi:hypothetical protein